VIVNKIFERYRSYACVALSKSLSFRSWRRNGIIRRQES